MNRSCRVVSSVAAAVLFIFASVSQSAAQTAPASAARPAPPPGKVPRHVLVIAQTHGFEHDSVPDAMAAVYNMGKESGLWDTVMRTDTELITKKELTKNAKNLNYFDAIVFASPTGELDLNDEQKAALLSFVHDDGKGYVGIHAAIDTLYEWPEYGKMTGGWFDQHPWGTFNAPIRNEGGDFPATRHFPASFHKYDEIYQAKDWSRANVNVLLSLDPAKLDYNNPRVHRADHDFAVAWSKMYGKGRVFYSTLGHTTDSWKDPDIRTMYFEAIKWSLGMTDGSTASHPAPPAK
ncbi:MAG: ThuA domain-containing protein [Acidobacteria bacterium]|nr:ThuA domain-containing protein [Acidobacteriota bacterium]